MQLSRVVRSLFVEFIFLIISNFSANADADADAGQSFLNLFVSLFSHFSANGERECLL